MYIGKYTHLAIYLVFDIEITKTKIYSSRLSTWLK